MELICEISSSSSLVAPSRSLLPLFWYWLVVAAAAAVRLPRLGIVVCLSFLALCFGESPPNLVFFLIVE